MIRVANKRIIDALALRRIKAGKTRNLFAIIAIVLTSVLVTTVLTLGVGLMDANRNTLMRSSGQKSEVSFEYLTANEVARIAVHPLIKEYGVSRFVARAGGGIWEQKPLEIKAMDSAFADFSFSVPTIGKLPENESEVAVKSWMLDELGLSREIGQVFPLSFMIGDEQHDLELTVCGIWDDDYYLHPYGAAIIADELADKLLAGIDPSITRTNGEYCGIAQLYANLNGAQRDLQSNLDKIVADTGIDTDLTKPRLSYAYENTAWDIQSLAAIALILLIVLIGGCLLIYNIFYISVIQDIKHYGLLKTIGTTKPQIKRIVNVQAFIFCLIGIPLGLLIGYFLAVVLLPLLLAFTTLEGDIAVSLNLPTVIVAALLSLITVFISCSHPARIAGKISPVEATRFTGVAMAQKKAIKGGYNGAKIGHMAFANLFRNRKKTIITLASVSFGLILFNIVFTFASSFDVNKALENYMYGDFLVADGSYLNEAGIYDNPAYSLTEKTVEEIAALDGVADVAKVYYQYSNQMPRKDTETPIPAQIYGMDDYWLDRLEESVIAGTFDRAKFLSGQYAVIGADPQNLFAVGDNITLNFNDDSDGKQYAIMAKVDYDRIWALTARFLSVPGFSAYLPETEFAGRNKVDIMSATVIADIEQTDNLQREIGAIAAGNPGLDFRSRSDYIAEMERINGRFAVVGVSLCLIVLLIGLLNFINTIITNIMSRKYEFAMLQAIGMTVKQSRTMLTLESLYFALIIGAVFVSVGYVASFGIVRMLTENTAVYTYQFTALPLLLCFPLLLLIAVIIPRQTFKSISRDSVVERLRETA